MSHAYRISGHVLRRSTLANDRIENRADQPRPELPQWAEYAITAAGVAILTGVLLASDGYIAVSEMDVAYISVTMAAAYLFGKGPAILAYILGFLAYGVLFIPPQRQVWPLAETVEGWTMVGVYLVFSLAVGGAALSARRRKIRIQQLAAELGETSRRLKFHVENSPLAVIEWDPEYRITMWNEEAERMFGWRAKEVLGRHIEEFPFVHEEDWPAVQQLIADMLAGRSPRNVNPNRNYRKNGSVIYCEWYNSALRDESGRLVSILSQVQDITEHVTARTELERAYSREHRIAETLQTSLMRPVPGRIDNFEFETLYKAALDEARVGGDFYDVFQIDDDRIGVVVGDVSGKGLAAAVQVATAKYSIRCRTQDCSSPSLVLEQVNNSVVQDTNVEGFVTIFLGLLDREHKTLTYANGGHSPAVLWDATKQAATLIEPTGPVLGVERGLIYTQRIVQLRPLDELLLATDGLYEIRYDNHPLGISRLLAEYAGLKKAGVDSATQLLQHITEMCHGDLRDDVAILRITLTK
ncbi:MAG: SpoIIE family protein phosphatase [Armatimonadetes bacterium]|nr:SpoIIE family protein phosphatase [Armatimonadota bacterium]